jgi:hypothetical protein
VGGGCWREVQEHCTLSRFLIFDLHQGLYMQYYVLRWWNVRWEGLDM